MMKLLSIELKKTLPNNVFRIMAGFFLFFLPLWTLGLYGVIGKVSGMPMQMFLSFPGVWANVTWAASWFNLLLGLIIIMFVCMEFSNKTVRQNVIDGQSREDFLVGKLLLMLLFSVIAALYAYVLAMVLGAIYSDSMSAEVLFDNMHLVAVFALQSFAYMSVALVMAVLLRNTVLTILLYLPLIFFEFILRQFIPDAVGRFFPMNLMSNELTPLPLGFDAAPPQMTVDANGNPIPLENPPMEALELWQSCGLVGAYVGAFILLSFLVLRKRNL